MSDGMDYEKLKKKKKTALSITIDTDNLEFLKEDMKREGVKDMPISAVFDNLLGNFVEFKKQELNKKEKKKEDDTKKP